MPYDAEAWALLRTDATALRVLERKVLRKIFGLVRVGDDFRIRFNIKCAGSAMSFVWKMLRQDRYLMRVFVEVGEEDRWRDQIEEAPSSIGVANWRSRARSRDAWKDVLRQAEIR